SLARSPLSGFSWSWASTGAAIRATTARTAWYMAWKSLSGSGLVLDAGEGRDDRQPFLPLAKLGRPGLARAVVADAQGITFELVDAQQVGHGAAVGLGPLHTVPGLGAGLLVEFEAARHDDGVAIGADRFDAVLGP